jgi:hypothetical protein
VSVVIASTEGFMVGDRRVSADGERCRPSDKVFGNDDLLVGVVGTYFCVRKVRKAMSGKGAARNPDDLVEAIDEHSIALCVYQGQLWEVDEEGAERVPERVHSVGSGAHAALGYLAGSEASDLVTCKDAIKFAFTLRCDCGDGVKAVFAKR